MSNKAKIIVNIDYINSGNPLQQVEIHVYENCVQDTANVRRHVFTRKAEFDQGEINLFSVFADKHKVQTSIDFNLNT